MTISPDSWKGKNILVTGGTGFIGSHLTRRLVAYGANVAVTTKYKCIIDNVRIADVWEMVTVIEADLRNLDALMEIRNFQPEIVFHLAAYNHVGGSFIQISESSDCNAKGTSNLITAIGDFERFVYVSTSEVYGTQLEIPFTESMTPCPVSPYSVAKYAGEQYCRMQMEEMNRPIAIVRPFNAFGPYQSTRAVIAEMILSCLEGRPIYSTEGIQTREFNFVENLVDGLLLTGTAKHAVGNVINIGSGEEISIRDVIQLIHDETNSSSELHIGALDYRPTEIWRMFADNRRAKRILDWKPRIGFREGMQHTISWFQEFQKQFRTQTSGNVKISQIASTFSV